MAPIDTYIYILSLQLVNCLEELVDVTLLAEYVLGHGLEKPTPVPVSFCLMFVDQDIKLSTTALAPCLPVFSCHDDKGLTLRNHKQAPN